MTSGQDAPGSGALSGTMKTPFGEAKKSTVAAMAGVVVVVGVIWYRQKKASAAAATASAGASTGIDPATGYTYGSPEDAAALANQALYQTASGGGTSAGGGGSSSSTGFSTNAEWVQAVIAYMVNANLVSDDGAAMSAALGQYINGLPVTSDQATLIHQAIAAEGPAPVAGAAGYPPGINTSNTTTSPTPTGVPAAPDGFSARPTSSTTVDLWWHIVPGVNGYTVWIRKAGSQDTWITVGSTVNDNSTTITARGLSPHTNYEALVRSENAAGFSPYSNLITVATP